MKKKVMLGVIAAMVVSMSATVFAAPSIGQIIPEDPEIITSTLYDEWRLRVQAIDGTDEKALDAYTKIEALKSILRTVNDEKNKPTIEQIEDALKELKVEDLQKVKTESEDEIDLRSDLFHLGGIQHDHLLDALGHRGSHCPAAANGLLIGLACAAAGRGQRGQLEPGMILKQGHKTLPHHARCANDTNFILFFHFQHLSFQ